MTFFITRTLNIRSDEVIIFYFYNCVFRFIGGHKTGNCTVIAQSLIAK